MNEVAERTSTHPPTNPLLRLFLCGDVMTGRGVDQVMAHPCKPELHESYVQSALGYVRIAEAANGPIRRRVDPAYVWAAALDELKRMRPDVRIVNLETSITHSEDYVPKGINYRMSPQNADCLAAAAIDCCVLANNHVLDWGPAGLIETLVTLERLKIKVAGAGLNAQQAGAPAILDIPAKTRILIFSLALPTSGEPRNWSATKDAPGINFLRNLSEASTAHICEQIARIRRPHDVVVVSIHWGPNWGYEIPEEQRRFAHALIDSAGVSIVHGHSSHHAKAIEVYRNRLILYGCGDFLNDYEGIRGYEEFRDDLGLMYFADIDTGSRDLKGLEIIPLQIRNFRLIHPPPTDVDWVHQTLDRESRRFGASVSKTSEGNLLLSWSGRNELSPDAGS